MSSIRYVSATGDDANDGLTWAKAKASVGAAIADLPVTGETAANQRHEGQVLVGPGTFIEQPLELNANLQIIGVAPNLTTLKLADSAGGPLLAPTAAFTNYAHYARLAQLTLDGNGGSNAGQDIVQIMNGGFNAVLRDVCLKNAGAVALRILSDAVNLYLYNCSGTDNADAFLRLELASGANLCNLGMWGTQIDDSGAAPIQIVGEANGDAHNVVISGLETESEFAGIHQHVIAVTNTGANPIGLTVDGVSAYQGDPPGSDDAVLYEAGTHKNVWSVRNVRGSGYGEKFRSTITGTVITAHIDEGLFGGLRYAD